MKFKCSCGVVNSYCSMPNNREGFLLECGDAYPSTGMREHWEFEFDRSWLWCSCCGSLWIDCKKNKDPTAQMVRFLPAKRGDEALHPAPENPFDPIEPRDS